MPLEYELQANQKAFEVNMDPRIYGAFAEIGAQPRKWRAGFSWSAVLPTRWLRRFPPMT